MQSHYYDEEASEQKSLASLTALMERLSVVIHLGLGIKGDIQLVALPVFAMGTRDNYRGVVHDFIKSIRDKGNLKSLASKNKLKLTLGKWCSVIPNTAGWWKQTENAGEPSKIRSRDLSDKEITLSRSIGDSNQYASVSLIIDNKGGGSKSIIEIAQILKEGGFELSAPLENFLRVCNDLQLRIASAKESGDFFYFSTVEQHNLFFAFHGMNGNYKESIKRLGWRSSFKFFSEVSETPHDLLFMDSSKRRPGSFQDMPQKNAHLVRQDAERNIAKSVELTKDLYGVLRNDEPVVGPATLKVPDIGYEDFETFMVAFVGPFIECRLFDLKDEWLEKRLRGHSIDLFFDHSEASPYRKGQEFLWKILFGHSEKVSEKSVSGYDRALAKNAGLKHRSAYVHFLELFPTKAMQEGGFLLTSPTSEGLSKIDFAVPLPEYASLTPIQKEKWKTRGESEPTYSLKSFLEASRDEGHSSCVWTEKFVWPQGRLYQLIELSTAMVTVPRLGTTAEFLFEDEVGVSGDVKKFLGKNELVAAIPKLSLAEAYGRLEGLFPTNTAEESLHYPDGFNTVAAFSVSHVHSLGPKEQISINVRYTNADGLAIEQCLEALKKDFRTAEKGEGSAITEGQNSRVGPVNGASGVASKNTPSNYDAILEKLKNLLQFDAVPFFMINGKEVSEAEWFQAKKSPSGVYEVAPGTFVPESTYTAQTETYYLKKKALAKMGRIPMQKVWTTHLNFVSGNDAAIDPDAYLQSLKTSISKEFDRLDEILKSTSAKDWIRRHVPVLEGSLREYQAQGIMWIKSRLAMNYGVCLADEMGLGKTLQAIGLLLLLKNPKLPSLVVMPKSLLINWKNELERFAPELKVRFVEDESSFDGSEIYLMSYGAMRHKSDLITKREWNLTVLDEAQSIKNSQSLTAQIAGELTSKYRLALSGTPVENHASELWSIINWLNPQYLGSVTSFEKFIKQARTPEKRPYYLSPLRECLKPIILRRLKNDPEVALGLPEKISQDVRFELSEIQCLLYKSVIDVVVNANVPMHPLARMAQFLRSIQFLKQICIHPSLFLDDVSVDEAMETSDLTKRIKKNAFKVLKKYESPKTSADLFKDSAKLSRLYEILEEVKTTSNGILIFTQYLKAAELVKVLLKDLGYDSVPFINGSLTANRRQEIVDEFNQRASQKKPEQICPILICSLKAGGTGLNLTGADRVIHLDRWWNPAVENQATDRAHRFGQTRTVFVNTLTNDGTLEDSIGRIFAEKQRLAQDLLSDEDVALAESLKDESGYLNLVDPKQFFYKH